MARKKKGEKEEADFATIFNSYIKNSNSLRTFVRNVAPTVAKYDKRLLSRIDRIFKETLKITGAKGITVDKKSGNVEISVKTEEQAERISNLWSSFPRLPTPQTKLLYKSSFVMLICYFDFLISDLIHCYYRLYPEDLSGKELVITLSELKSCTDINDAIDNMINKKIDAILYGNLESQKNFLKNDLKIDIKQNHIRWAVINEAVERRNIIVHNDSKINRRYLENVDLTVIPEKANDIKDGKQITVNDSYFNNRSDEFLIAGIILTQCCWRKWGKSEITDADAKLINTMYDALSEEKWTVAERLGLFSKECKTKDEANRLYLNINYCQSLKWQNKQSELEKELVNFDISSISPKYVLAVCALKSDRDGFYKNIEKAIIVNKMAKRDFMEWPLFRELRKEAIYKDKIDEAFLKISEKEQKGSA